MQHQRENAGNKLDSAALLRAEHGTVLVRITFDSENELHLPTRADLDAYFTNWEAVKVVQAEVVGNSQSPRILAFLFQLAELATTHNAKFDDSRLAAPARRLIDLARRVPEKADALRKNTSSGLLHRLGNRSIAFGLNTVKTLEFVGECIGVLGRFAFGRVHLRRRDFWVNVQDVSASALPIVALISFLVGLIIAFLGAVVLERFAAEYYVSYLVGYGMLREMGAIMAGIIMAGRTGAAYAAEIGSMKVNEEIDALKTFGISPYEFIVLPRILALVLIMPALTIYSDFIGIVGGYLVATSMIDIAPTQFFQGLSTAVGLRDLLLGVFKGGVFGILVALSGCLRGFQCGHGASAVGLAATSAVVTGITLIIIANAVIDWLAALYGI